MSQGKNSVVDSNTILIKWRNDRASFKKTKEEMIKGFGDMQKLPSTIIKQQQKLRKQQAEIAQDVVKTGKQSKKQSDKEKKQSVAVAKALKEAEKAKSVAVKKNMKVEADRYKLVQRASDLSGREQQDLIESMGRLGTEFKDNKISAQMYSAKLSELTKKTSALVREQKKLKKVNPHQAHLSSLQTQATDSLTQGYDGKRFERTKSAAKTAAKVGAVSSIAGVGVAVASMNKASTDAMELDKQARLAQMDVESFQKLAYAYQQMGFSADDAADHFKDLDDKLADFQANWNAKKGTSTGAFADVQAALHISGKTIKNWKSAEQALTQIFDSPIFQRDKKVRAFVLEALGNDLTGLIPLFQDSAKLLRQYSNDAQNLGIVLSDIDVKNLVAIKKDTISIGQQFDGLADKFTLSVFKDADVTRVKEVNDGMKALGDLAALAGNRVGFLVSGIGKAANAMMDVKEAVTDFAKPIVKTVTNTVENVVDYVTTDRKGPQATAREKVNHLNPATPSYQQPTQQKKVNFLDPMVPTFSATPYVPSFSSVYQQSNGGTQRVQVDVNQKPIELSLKTDNNALFELVDDRASNIVTNTFNNQQQRLTRGRE